MTSIPSPGILSSALAKISGGSDEGRLKVAAVAPVEWQTRCLLCSTRSGDFGASLAIYTQNE